VLGLVSLLMDVSSEMVHGLLPVFLVSVLGASATAIGLIEGVGEGIALVTRMFSGVISDCSPWPMGRVWSSGPAPWTGSAKGCGAPPGMP
jgi:Na+/melibiose symporter-like transporter